MNATRFNECLESQHWSTETLAGILECDEGLTEAYSMGLEEVPMKLGVWLEMLALAHDAAEDGKPKSLRGKRFTGLMQ